MEQKLIAFDCETDYLKTEPFKLSGDFSASVYFPGVSGNYFPVKPMKTKKPKKPTERQLQSEIKQLQLKIDDLKTDLFKTNNEFSKTLRELENVRNERDAYKLRCLNQTKAAGLYFAALNSECSATESTLAYLRQLRAEIFQ